MALQLPGDRPPYGPGRGFFVAFCLLIFLACLSYVIFGPSPFKETLDFSAEAKESVRTRSYVVEGEWWAALVNGIIALLMLVAGLFYPRPEPVLSFAREGSEKTPWQKLSAGSRRFVIFGTLAAVIFSAWLNASRLTHSLWGDEEATARRFIVGHVHRQDEDGKEGEKPSFKLVTPKWQKTLWNFDNGPNNHVLFSVLSRLSHSLGPDPSDQGPEDWYFSEFLIRLPSYVAGLCAIAATSWLVVLLGFPRAGPVAGLLLAIHPWFVRWGVEARGYALELFLVPLCLAFLSLAVRSEKMRWWVAFGLGEFLVLYAHLGAIYFVLPLNAAAFLLAWQFRGNPFRSQQLWRLAFANGIAAMLLIQLLSPIVHPLRTWLDSPRPEGVIDAAWIHDWGAYFASGMPWHEWSAANEASVTLKETLAAAPILGQSVLAVLVFFFVLGFFRMCASGTRLLVMLALLLPGPLTLLHAKLGGTLLYPWYMVGFLPGVIVGVAAGMDLLNGTQKSERTSPAPFLIVSVLFLGAFFVLTSPQRSLYRERSVEALAKSVRSTREIVNPFHEGIDGVITVGFVHHTRLYDPAAHLLDLSTREAALKDFRAQLRAADDSGKPLYVNTANLGLARDAFPEVMDVLEDSHFFEDPVVFPGLQPATTRHVYQYRGTRGRVAEALPPSP